MKLKLQYLVVASLLGASALAAPTPASAQIPAFLPSAEEVAPVEASSADGTYIVSTIDKRITIENGRAYVIDGWTHAFVLSVKPGMVTLQNFRQTGPDEFEADDLPMMGKVIFYRQPNGTLQGVVQGAMGEAKYALLPTDYVGLGDILDPIVGGPPPPPIIAEQPRVYRLHVSGSGCDGKALIRKRYRGQVRISVVDREGDKLASNGRNFDVRCTDKGPRKQNFVFYKDGPAALQFAIPPGEDGVTDLRISGQLNDPLGRVPFSKKNSDLFAKARALGRDLNVGEKVIDRHDMTTGKTVLNFTLTLERIQ
ncbi:MAG: hypothetical protein AAFR88_00865 [Pseudomonadota bacterium]